MKLSTTPNFLSTTSVVRIQRVESLWGGLKLQIVKFIILRYYWIIVALVFGGTRKGPAWKRFELCNGTGPRGPRPDTKKKKFGQ